MNPKIIKALGQLADDATETQVLERIADLRRLEDDDEEKEHVDRIADGTHDQVARNENGTLTLTLLYPFKSGTETVDTLILRRPQVRHMKAMDDAKGDISKVVAQLAAVTGRSPKELNELDAHDLLVATACLGFFSRHTRRTGAVS